MRHMKSTMSERLHPENVRARLEQECRDLQRRIDRTERLFRDPTAGSADLLDNIGSDRDALIERASHYRQRLRTVLRTLHRLQQGRFGICAECDEPIPPKRLDAIPTAEYCIKCQQELEQTAPEYVI